MPPSASMLRGTLSRTLSARRPASAAVARRQFAQATTTIVVPPRVKLSGTETIFHGLFMVSVWLSVPFWTLTQIPVWRDKYGA